jgi:F-type H+-transporting ATPase subunit epsilon
MPTASPLITHSFHIVVVSPDKVLIETEATKAVVPGIMQELAILPDHTPLYTELVKGTIKIDTALGKTKEIDVEGGILRVRQNHVSIILGFEKALEGPNKT